MFLMTENQNTRETKGYFVNIRLLDDGFDDSVFRDWVVTPRAPAQGVVLRIADGYHVDTSCALCRGSYGYWLVFTGNWAYGAIAGCTFFIAREHTRAEYRWIEMFGHGKRINMPWWGGFDPRAWDGWQA